MFVKFLHRSLSEASIHWMKSASGVLLVLFCKSALVTGSSSSKDNTTDKILALCLDGISCRYQVVEKTEKQFCIQQKDDALLGFVSSVAF